MADAPPPMSTPSPAEAEEDVAQQAATVPLRLQPGQRVRLNRVVPYLKSADPMPMLRPPDLVDPGETGQVVALRAGLQVAVRFRRGTFLLEQDELLLLTDPG